MTAGAVSLKKSHDIVISSFCIIVKGQANCVLFSDQTLNDIFYDSDCVTDITLYLANTTR